MLRKYITYSSLRKTSICQEGFASCPSSLNRQNSAYPQRAWLWVFPWILLVTVIWSSTTWKKNWPFKFRIIDRLQIVTYDIGTHWSCCMISFLHSLTASSWFWTILSINPILWASDTEYNFPFKSAYSVSLWPEWRRRKKVGLDTKRWKICLRQRTYCVPERVHEPKWSDQAKFGFIETNSKLITGNHSTIITTCGH